MATICPTVTAYEAHEYREQIERIGFADRIHIDLMDGVFAPTTSIFLDSVWWPRGTVADIHLMAQHPMEVMDHIIKLAPHMVIIHAEAEVDHMLFCAELHKHDIKTGVAILQQTTVDETERIIHSFDHVLVFSGNLGYHGGEADLQLLQKVKEIKHHHPEVEIGWDGGVHEHNAKALIDAGVDVLNVGGFIQKSDDPKSAYDTLLAIAS